MVIIRKIKSTVLMTCIALTLMTGSVSAQKINLAEVFVRSNIGQCVELQFEGFAIFTKISPSFLTGVSVRVIASPITSHYNPDFTVSAYPRLGTSPSLESFVVFGAIQNALSEPVVEILSGFDVPASYTDLDQWGTPGSEGREDNTKSILRYYETEVLGHPGNIYTAVSRALNGDVPIDSDNIGNVVTEIPRQLSTFPSVLSSSVTQLANGATSLGSAFPNLQGDAFNPVLWARELFSENLAELYSLLPDDVLGSIREIATSAGTEAAEVITGAIADAQNIDLNEEIENITGGGDDGGSSGGQACDPSDPECGDDGFSISDLDISGLPDHVSEEIRNYFADLGAGDLLNFVAPGFSEQLEEVTSLVETYESFTVSINNLTDAAGGIAARVEPWAGFCPSDTSPMVPYFLSGMNVPGWRFKIPELVYPQTYVPFSNETTIGNFDPLAVLGLGNESDGEPEGEPHNYGSVYPRNGYLMQADSVKAGAVAAFRAAHIVTRPGQPYLYRNAEPLERDDEFYMFDNRYEDFGFSSDRRDTESTYLHPHIEETGRWQLIHSEGGELDESCQTFGDPSVNPHVPLVDASNIAGLLSEVPVAGNLLPENQLPRQWSEGKQAEDHQYVFNLWRRYRCAPDPDDSSSVTFHNFNLILPTLTVIE